MGKSMRNAVAICAGGALALAFGSPVRAQSAPTAKASAGTFVLRLKPVRDSGDKVTAIEVRAEVHGSEPPAAFSLTTPVNYAGNPGIADRVEKLVLRDRHGIVPLRIQDDPANPGGFPYFRHWRAERPVSFPATFSYRARVAPDGGPPGPPFSIRPTGEGVSGSGAGFLILPEGVKTASNTVSWDLSGLPTGSIASTTFGDGKTFKLKGPPQALMQGWYLAGRAGRFPATGDKNGFSATWLGKPPYDPAIEMAWAGEAYTWLGKFFRYLNPPPRYRVFIRAVPPPNAGGTALGASFMTAPRPASDAHAVSSSPRNVFLHEMIHMWVGGIEAPMGVSSWFSEGLTTYYTRLLALRAGYTSVEEYARDVNVAMKEYYGSSALNMTAEQITAVGFTNNQVREMPYVRGAYYFADLDARIRARSGGRRKLDDVLLPLFERREKGERFDHDAWLALLGKELGPEAQQQFKDVILGGATLQPLEHAFGPCLKREARTYEVTDRAPVQGYTWVRDPSVADELCRGW
jgi:hypothetical protein